MILSKYLKPFDCSSKIKRTSITVIKIPHGNGMPKSKLRAMVAPITSAKSQAAMTILQSIQSMKFVLSA